tara:strand:- start:902 stop:1087 length:186 start_codon:yes stop_codon:yes gene_type:complete
MANAEAMGRQEKPKVGVQESGLAPKKAMLTVREVLASRSARTHPALMLFPAKSGSAVERSR